MLFLILLLAGLRCFHYYGDFVRGSDGQVYYAQLRSLVFDKDLDISNELLELTTHPECFPELKKTQKIDKIHNNYTFGWTLTNLIPYLLLYLILKFFYAHLSGYEAIFQISPFLWQIFLLFVFCRLHYKKYLSSNRDRLWLLFLFYTFFLGSNFFYYITIYPNMNHICSVIWGFIYIYYLLNLHEHNNKNLISLMVLCLSLFMLTLVRPTDAIYIVLLMPILYRYIYSRQFFTAIKIVVMASIAILLAYLLQVFIWSIDYNKLVFNAYQTRYHDIKLFSWTNPHLFTYLFGKNGAFITHPIYLISFVITTFLLFTKDKNKILYIAIFLVFCSHIYLASCWFDWGDTYGQRAFLSLVPVCCLSCFLFFRKLSNSILLRACFGLFFLCTVYNLYNWVASLT
ncbi:hypothetical protein JCM13304A_02260 [Desulfothermus okinawensis JCM 13304]